MQAQVAQQQGIAAFVPVMIWEVRAATARSARAPLTGNRTRQNWREPLGESVATKLLKGARVVREAGPVVAFRLLNNSGHIKYLGGAFFTKWLSFASALVSVDGEEVAPILDKRVRDWIDRQTRKTAPINLSTTSTVGYATYLSLLDAWRVGDGWSRTRAQVELAIFELGRPSEWGRATHRASRRNRP